MEFDQRILEATKALRTYGAQDSPKKVQVNVLLHAALPFHKKIFLMF